PFGAVIVKDNSIVGEGKNMVTRRNDPTAHAEIVAIRNACKQLHTFDLSGCIIYTSCEPCPMCLGAIYWAHIEKIIYANTRADAAAIHFDDAFIYEELAKHSNERKIEMQQLGRLEALKVFESWQKKENKITY
ncbi:MAG: nucleoside deaminase, partial [Chitinophagales bacterium]|nr:nucleoside deaminase [Chitinophagales bacterium]